SSISYEFLYKENYSSKRYFCPWGQNDSINHKLTIIENYDFIKTTLSLDSLYEAFSNRLPKGKTYSKDGGYRIRYIMTEKQAEGWTKDKPRRDYLKSIKDTIDTYINTKLNSQ